MVKAGALKKAQRWAKIENGYEINKLASKIERLGICRIYFRIDYVESILLVEKVAIGLLKQLRDAYYKLRIHVYQVNRERVTFQKKVRKVDKTE
jgi:hypothetical protein